MMMRRESQSPTVAGVFTELCSAGAAAGAATGADAGLLVCCSKWKHLLSVAWPMMELKVR